MKEKFTIEDLERFGLPPEELDEINAAYENESPEFFEKTTSVFNHLTEIKKLLNYEDETEIHGILCATMEYLANLDPEKTNHDLLSLYVQRICELESKSEFKNTMGGEILDLITRTGDIAYQIGLLSKYNFDNEHLIFALTMMIIDAGSMVLEPSNPEVIQFVQPRIKDIIQFKKKMEVK